MDKWVIGKNASKCPKQESGFSLLMTALCLVVMLGMLGLAVDAGQMFLMKNELQAFADSAAIAAATKLDGTQQGVINAETVAGTGPLGSSVPNAINFDAQTVPTTSVVTGYRANFSDANTDYKSAKAASTNTYRFVQVTASAPVNLNFLPVIGIMTGPITTQVTVSANAVAGQQANPRANAIAPFSPDAPDPNAANFGFQTNQQYTLKWGNKNATSCAGDLAQNTDPSNEPSEHGFINTTSTQGHHGNNGIAADLLYDVCDVCPLDTVANNLANASDTVNGDPGQRTSVTSLVAQRSNQDPDQTSTTWQQYSASSTANGRRLIVVPIHNAAQTTGTGGNLMYTIIGFAKFLLNPGSTYTGNDTNSICATYVGAATTYNGGSGGPTGGNIYSIVLYQ